MTFLADCNPLLPAPAWLNSGDTAWQLTSAMLVGLMRLPGLAIIYGGLVKKKWALNSAVMCFYALSVVLLAWCCGATACRSAIIGSGSAGTGSSVCRTRR